MMVPLFRLCAPLAALLLSAAPAMAADAAPYTPPEGDFTVAFAAAPQVQVKEAKRSKDVAYRRYVDQSPSRALIVAVDQYPDNTLPHLVDAGVYDRLMRDHADDSNQKLVSTRPARCSGRPCLEGAFADDNGVDEIIRVLIVGNSIWRLTYAHADGDPSAPAGAAAFFGSFKLMR